MRQHRFPGPVDRSLRLPPRSGDRNGVVRNAPVPATTSGSPTDTLCTVRRRDLRSLRPGAGDVLIVALLRGWSGDRPILMTKGLPRGNDGKLRFLWRWVSCPAAK